MEGEDDRDAVAGHGHGDHRGETVAQDGGGDGGDGHGDHDEQHDRVGGQLHPQSLACADEQRGEREHHQREQDDAQGQGQGAALDARGESQREDVEEAEHPVVDPVGVTEGGRLELHPFDDPLRDVEQETKDVHDQCQGERNADAVPQTKVVALVATPWAAGRERHVDKPDELCLDGGGPQAQDESRGGEDGGHGEEECADGPGLGHGGADAVGEHALGAERAHDQARGVREGEDGARDEPGGDDDCGHAVKALLGQHGGERGLLADEPEERRESRHRRRCHGEEHGQRGARSSEAGELPDLAGAGGLVDHADSHEQRGLEQRVGQQHGQAGEHRVARADAHQHQQESQLRDGSERQDQLEVGLAQCAPAGHEQRDQPQCDERHLPGRRAGHARAEGRHQEDAGLDHGRGVQVGAHRRGGGHGAGEPEVQRRDG